MTFCSVVRDAQHHLAALAALGDTGEGRARVLEQKDRVDRRFQLAGVRESGELDELRAARLYDEIPGALCLLGHRDDASAGAERLRQCGAADRVEDEIARLVGCGQPAARELDGEVADPALAPRTRTRWPSRRAPWSKRPCQALSPASVSAALAMWVRRRGFDASTAAGTTAYSTATPSRSNGVSAKTSSPSATSRTSCATSATTPDSS